MQYWLMKSEPSVYSIDHLKSDKKTCWEGVRNYQARNTMRDLMKKGDQVFFYHSNAEPPGIAGIAKVASESYPDPYQFDKKSKYYDEKSKKENPRWMLVDVGFVKKFKKLIPLEDLRSVKGLEKMPLLQKGQRLSVQPVSEKEWKIILNWQNSFMDKQTDLNDPTCSHCIDKIFGDLGFGDQFFIGFLSVFIVLGLYLLVRQILFSDDLQKPFLRVLGPFYFILFAAFFVWYYDLVAGLPFGFSRIWIVWGGILFGILFFFVPEAYSLYQQDHGPADEGFVRCPECKAQVLELAKYCEKCGREM